MARTAQAARTINFLNLNSSASSLYWTTPTIKIVTPGSEGNDIIDDGEDDDDDGDDDDDDDDDDANNAVGQRTCEYEDDDKMKEGTLAVTALITIPGN